MAVTGAPHHSRRLDPVGRNAVTELAFTRGGEMPRADENASVAMSMPAGRSEQVRRWTINGDFLALAPTGIARYAREVTWALDALLEERHPLTSELRVELVTAREPDEAFRLSNIAYRVVPEATRPRLPQAWVQFQLPRQAPGGLLSFCNLAPIGHRHHIACIHDVQTRVAPESYTAPFRLMHRVIMPLVGRFAARIVTVSGGSRDHLVQFGIAPRRKIVVAHNGGDHALRWRPEKARLNWQRERPFVFCIGRPQAHKNPELIWQLASLLEKHGIDVVVAGDIDPDASDLPRMPRPSNLELIGRIADDDVAAALSAALCFALPSRTEGFGLPAVEAMSLGCPVIASTAPALPEVCAEGAIYADPEAPAAWAQAVMSLAGDPGLRERLRDAGRSRAGGFTWRKVAETYLALMQEMDDERRLGLRTGRR